MIQPLAFLVLFWQFTLVFTVEKIDVQCYYTTILASHKSILPMISMKLEAKFELKIWKKCHHNRVKYAGIGKFQTVQRLVPS